MGAHRHGHGPVLLMGVVMDGAAKYTPATMWESVRSSCLSQSGADRPALTVSILSRRPKSKGIVECLPLERVVLYDQLSLYHAHSLRHRTYPRISARPEGHGLLEIPVSNISAARPGGSPREVWLWNCPRGCWKMPACLAKSAPGLRGNEGRRSTMWHWAACPRRAIWTDEATSIFMS